MFLQGISWCKWHQLMYSLKLATSFFVPFSSGYCVAGGEGAREVTSEGTSSTRGGAT